MRPRSRPARDLPPSAREDGPGSRGLSCPRFAADPVGAGSATEPRHRRDVLLAPQHRTELGQGDLLSGVQHSVAAPPSQRDRAVAADLGHGRVQVDDQGGVLVHAEHADLVGQLGLEHVQPLLAEVAEPGVIAAALGVVVVGDDDRVDAGQGAQQVQARDSRTGRRRPCRSRRPGWRDCRPCRRPRAEDQGATPRRDVEQCRRQRGVPPLSQRVARAARPGEHPAGPAEQGQGALLLGLRAVDRCARWPPRPASRPTRRSTAWVLATRSSALAWKPNVVSRNAAGPCSGTPASARIARCDLDHRGSGLSGPHDDESAHRPIMARRLAARRARGRAIIGA